jgi:hypothetical protein
MAEYQHYPDPSYGIELRDNGWTTDDYIAQARGFRSTAEFREYRDADSDRKAEIIRDRKSGKPVNSDDGDLFRYVELLKAFS